ncbi:hypothetical protein ACFQMF_04185 [Halorubrum rutilum]|uniref:DUF7827 domain-containing protein n=1 Tax=Halorubrum rutilum TaxID=1364933 RepID=A0ABD6AIF3_9EURY|nr:hypothetical protein [Halorubrum rutilum]
MDTRLTLAAVLLVGVAGIAAPLAAPAAAQSEPAVGFGDARTTVAQGDVATIDLQLRNADRATLQINAASLPYRATLRVHDGDGDGTVQVRANTFHGEGVDGDERFTAAGDADEARLLAEANPPEGAVLDTGRYNLIVSTAETSVAAVLAVEEPTASSSNATVVAPDASLNPEAGDSETTAGSSGDASADDGTSETDAADPLSAARSDQVRTAFAVSGIGGILESPAPANNLVFPANSAPSAQTVHTIETAPDEDVSVRSVTIDYGIDDAVPPRTVHQFTRSDIEAIGIDETGDGYIDRSVGIAIQNTRTSTDGRMTITFDRSVTIASNQTFRLAYAMENPEVTGPQAVSVALDGERTTHHERGTVLYGPAGQGTLGYGVDLRLTTADGEGPTAPLAAVETAYDIDNGGLVAMIDTDALATEEYAVELTVGEAAPEPVPRVSLREPFTVVEPTAEFTNRSVGDDEQLSVTADTNLAPEGSVIIRVEADESGGGISQVLNCVATVESDGAVGCEFDLSRSASDFDIEVSIQRDGSVIAGPTEYN